MRWTNILLLATVIVISICFAEIIFRVMYMGEVIGIDESDICSRKTYISVTNISNPRRFYPGNTAYFEYWNISGVRPKPSHGAYANWDVVLDGVRYEVYSAERISNPQRIKSFYEVNRTTDRLRIAAVGDSFTYGENVVYNYSYPEIMKKLIPGSDVLNFGMQGAGFDLIYFRYKYEALEYDPDVVVVGVYIDDIRRMRPCINKPKFIREGDELRIENFPPPSLSDIATEYKPRVTYSYLLDTIRYNMKYLGGVERKEYRYGLDISDLLIDDMKAEADKRDAKLVFLLISEGNLRDADELDRAMLAEFRQILISKGIPVLTSDGIFGSEGYVPMDPTRAENDTGEGNIDHFTPVGYAYLAQGLVNGLENISLIAEVPDYTYSWDIDTEIMTLREKVSGDELKWEPYYQKKKKNISSVPEEGDDILPYPEDEG